MSSATSAAGSAIAALDLEIRGAGNLLGGEQSGHIEAVGFDMYMKLLEQTIRELKGEDLEDERRAAVNLRLDLRIDETYIPDMNQRLSAYRRMASARTARRSGIASSTSCAIAMGAPPASVRNLAQYARIRLMADRIGLESVDREGQIVVLKFRPDAKVDPAMLLKLIQNRGDLTLAAAGGRCGSTSANPPRLRPESGAARPGPISRTPGAGAETTSWWTARATTDVATGVHARRDPGRSAARSRGAWRALRADRRACSIS